MIQASFLALVLGNAALADPISGQGSWTAPDPDRLPDDAQGRLVRLGKDLVVRTYAHIGPEVADRAERYAGNNLACQNCHLNAGTKKFGLPFVGVFGEFPQYRTRSGKVDTIEDRINGCMTRSLNGRALPVNSTEMRAIVAYIRFLSSETPKTGSKEGRGSGTMPELSRPADPARGEQIFGQVCAACHGMNGAGQRRGTARDADGYAIPPLWGPDSFNDGAGMNRLIYAANFVHNNMPFGADYTATMVSAEDAWDVAVFIDSQPRPHMANLERDYPKRLEKPVDISYGPYADGFGETAHRLGPFAPIRAAIEKLKQGPGTAGAPDKETQR